MSRSTLARRITQLESAEAPNAPSVIFIVGYEPSPSGAVTGVEATWRDQSVSFSGTEEDELENQVCDYVLQGSSALEIVSLKYRYNLE